MVLVKVHGKLRRFRPCPPDMEASRRSQSKAMCRQRCLLEHEQCLFRVASSINVVVELVCASEDSKPTEVNLLVVRP